MFDYLENKYESARINELEAKKQTLEHLIQLEKQSLSLIKKAFSLQAKVEFQKNYSIDVTLANMTNTILEIERQILLYEYKVTEIESIIDKLKS